MEEGRAKAKAKGGAARQTRAPAVTFAPGQEVLAWHRVSGWQNATVHSLREDGKYLLAWHSGDETDRVKSRTNLRKGVKDQCRLSAKGGAAPVPGALLEAEPPAVTLAAGGSVAGVADGAATEGGAVAGCAAKDGLGDMVLVGGDVGGGGMALHEEDGQEVPPPPAAHDAGSAALCRG